MTEKRFTINPSSIVDDCFVIIDNDKKYTFPILESTLNYMFCKALNELSEENNGLKKQITSLKVELDTHKHPLWSTREAERKVSELTDLLMNETKKNAILLKEINSLRKENMRLKEVQKYE